MLIVLEGSISACFAHWRGAIEVLLPTRTQNKTRDTPGMQSESKRRAPANHFLLLPLHEFAPTNPMPWHQPNNLMFPSHYPSATASTILNLGLSYLGGVCVRWQAAALHAARRRRARGFFISAAALSPSHPHLCPRDPEAAFLVLLPEQSQRSRGRTCARCR